MTFHRMLAGIQLLMLIWVVAWDVLYAPHNVNLISDLLFWSWLIFAMGSKIMLTAWSRRFQTLSRISVLAAVLALMVSFTQATETAGATRMLSFSEIVYALGVFGCVTADFFYSICPVPGLNEWPKRKTSLADAPSTPKS